MYVDSRASFSMSSPHIANFIEADLSAITALHKRTGLPRIILDVGSSFDSILV